VGEPSGHTILYEQLPKLDMSRPYRNTIFTGETDTKRPELHVFSRLVLRWMWSTNGRISKSIVESPGEAKAISSAPNLAASEGEDFGEGDL